MASIANSSLGLIAKPSLINTSILKLMNRQPGLDIAVGFEGLSTDEARSLIDFAIKLEQTRTGDVLSPTEYGNRFSGLDIG